MMIETNNKNITVSFEPSKRLSAILGYPYLIARSFTVDELVSKGIIGNDDLCQLSAGKEIQKSIPVIS